MDKQEISEKRKTDKIGLQMFVDHLKDNDFEDSVANEFSRLKDQLNKETNEFIDKLEKEGNSDFYLDTQYFDDKLLAIVEMKIVYLYKNFEINLKKLMTASYNVETKNFYRWDIINLFLTQKKIILKSLDQYKEVNQLRKVNNAIKHSSSILSKDLKSIAEFSEIKYLRHYELDEFYERIKFAPVKFLQSLSEKIYENLYEFDDGCTTNFRFQKK